MWLTVYPDTLEVMRESRKEAPGPEPPQVKHGRLTPWGSE